MRNSKNQKKDTKQKKLFESLPDEQTTDSSIWDIKKSMQDDSKYPSKTNMAKNEPIPTDFLPPPTQKSEIKHSGEKIVSRKMQVSNGHYLNFDHLARIMSALSSNTHKQIKMLDLAEETGLPFRQVRNRVSIARALGLINKNTLKLSQLGELVIMHDPFCEATATLEYLHYKAAGNYENLVWYETFNILLLREDVMDYAGWMQYFKNALSDQYTEKSLKDHLGKELRFIIDAYTVQSFQKLMLLQKDESGNLYRRRYSGVTPLVLCAMLYDFCSHKETNLYQIEDMAETPGSPAVLFGLDAAMFRQQIEQLHERGWLRYETTHNLDQVRLKQGLSAIELMSAYYEERDPGHKSKNPPGDILQ